MGRPIKYVGCSVSGCEATHYAKTLCRLHYKAAHHAARYAADPDRENARARAWEKAHPEHVRAQKAASYQKHKDQQLLLQAKRRAANPELFKSRVNASQAANPERFKATRKAYKKNNPHKGRADRALRKAAQLRATPAWANRFFIEEAYHLAALRTKAMGYPWHVDHIVPLRSKSVCGLHVENNLRVIPGVDNMKKSNRHWPDMPT